jgi:hypothetical protein
MSRELLLWFLCLLINDYVRWINWARFKLLLSLNLLLIVYLTVFVNVNDSKLTRARAMNLAEGTILRMIYASLGWNCYVGTLRNRGLQR